MEVDCQLDALVLAVVGDLDAAQVHAGACRQLLDQVLHRGDPLDNRGRVGDGAEDRIELVLQRPAALDRERGVSRIRGLGGSGVEADGERGLGDAIDRALERLPTGACITHAIATGDTLEQQVAALKTDRELVEAAVAEYRGDIGDQTVTGVGRVVAELERLCVAAEQVAEALVDQRDFGVEYISAGQGLNLAGNARKAAKDLGRGYIVEEVEEGAAGAA